jgi:CheY-like chemotaxis protein
MAGGLEKGRPTVLVAEDHDDSRQMLKVYLEDQGFAVLEAQDGLTAVEIGERDSLDLIFMDADLPKLDGISAARRLRQTEGLRALPIVMTSGWVSDAFREQALTAGCIAFVPKPIEFDQIDLLLLQLVQENGKTSFIQRRVAGTPLRAI